MTSWQTVSRQALLYRRADRYAKGVVSSLMLVTLGVLLFYPVKEVAVPIAKLAQVRITLVERPVEVVPPPAVVEAPKTETLLASESEVTVPVPEPEPVVEKVAPPPESVTPPPPPPPKLVVEMKPEPKPVVKPKVVKPVKKAPVVKAPAAPVTPTPSEATEVSATNGEEDPAGSVTPAATSSGATAGEAQGARSGSVVTEANESVELAKLVAIVEANKVYPRRARQNNE